MYRIILQFNFLPNFFMKHNLCSCRIVPQSFHLAVPLSFQNKITKNRKYFTFDVWCLCNLQSNVAVVSQFSSKTSPPVASGGKGCKKNSNISTEKQKYGSLKRGTNLHNIVKSQFHHIKVFKKHFRSHFWASLFRRRSSVFSVLCDIYCCEE